MLVITGLEDDNEFLDGPDSALFSNTDNVVLCQYDRIWKTGANDGQGPKVKFALKDGIMNLNGEDHVFLKADGEAYDNTA